MLRKNMIYAEDISQESKDAMVKLWSVVNKVSEEEVLEKVPDALRIIDIMEAYVIVRCLHDIKPEDIGSAYHLTPNDFEHLDSIYDATKELIASFMDETGEEDIPISTTILVAYVVMDHMFDQGAMDIHNSKRYINDPTALSWLSRFGYLCEELVRRKAIHTNKEVDAD